MDSAGTSENPVAVRLDKWLWATRFFKTRSLAAEACRTGQVTIGGTAAKPSRDVRAGDLISVKTTDITRTVKVLVPIQKRVGPKLVDSAVEDQTPASEYMRLIKKKEAEASLPARSKGAGRPTKKERRDLEKLEDSGLI